MCHWPRPPPTNQTAPCPLPRALSCGVDVRVCACEVLSFRTTTETVIHTHTHTYSYIWAGWVCASLKLHLIFTAHTHTYLTVFLFQNWSFPIIFAIFICRSTGFLFECSSWPGHVLHHASDMKSCFRLTFFYLFSYIYTYYMYMYMYATPRKNKSHFPLFEFSAGFCLSQAESSSTQDSIPLEPHMQVFMVSRCLICIFIDLKSIKTQLSLCLRHTHNTLPLPIKVP